MIEFHLNHFVQLIEYQIVLYNDLYLLKMSHLLNYLLLEMVWPYVHVELRRVHRFENHMDRVNHTKDYYYVIPVLLMNVVVNKNSL